MSIDHISYRYRTNTWRRSRLLLVTKNHFPEGGLHLDLRTAPGERKGCAALIEQHIGHALLWLTCRRHIYELHIKHAAVAVIGKTVGPDEGLFKRFRKDWDNIDHSVEDLVLFDWEPSEPFLCEQAEIVQRLGDHSLDNDTFPRENYKELVELTV